MKKLLQYNSPIVNVVVFSDTDAVRTSGNGLLSWSSNSGEGWGDFTQSRDTTFIGGGV